MVGLEYSRTDPTLPPDDRIDEAVTRVRDRVSRLRDGFVRNQDKNKKDKEDLRTLPGGSRKTPETKDTKKDTKPSTLDNQMAELNEKRRLTKDEWR
jgi:hypothetical protein